MNLKKFALLAVCLVAVAAVLSAGCISTEDSPRQVISLSSTIGPVDAGIIPALEDAYMEKNPNVVIRHIKAGTGATIDTAKTNDIVDLVVVHAKSLEEKFVADCW
jgi:tungstate transport system substrate-binding protein